MPSKSEIEQQVTRETERRRSLGVPAAAGGVLYLLSGIIISSTLKDAPTVGLLQGLAPALRGEANPTVSPRAAEVRFISHHALPLIAGSALAAIAIGALTLVLLLLLDATRFRRPETWRAAHPLVLVGGAGLALLSIAHQAVSLVEAHSFAVGHNFTNHAVDQALTQSTANVTMEYLDLLAGLALAVGMIAVMVNARRVGLIVRWMSILGIIAGVLIFLPLGGATLELVPSFWLVAMGIMFMGRLPSGEPPAWDAGESRPWPSRMESREQQAVEGQGSSAGGSALSAGRGDVAPEPVQPASGRSGKRRRKRGARG